MDPTLKNRTLSTLKSEIPSLSPRLKIVAKYIVDHPSDFGLDPIRETARKCGVSTYTLIRLAQHLGFNGFEDLRRPFRHALLSSGPLTEGPAWLDGLQDKGELGQTMAASAQNSMAIVQRTLERQSPEQMHRVVEMILGAETVFVTAIRASFAVAAYFHYVGRMALPTLRLVSQQMNSPIDELHSATSSDVMIAITCMPYSRETIEACAFARSKGVKLIVISDSDIVFEEFTPEETLVAATISTHHFGCYTGIMALVENLLSLLVRDGGDAAERRIKSYEDMRASTNAFWSAQKKH